MIKTQDIQIRDPFVLLVQEELKYYMYGTTDKNVWEGTATGFDGYTSCDLVHWNGPFPVFRPNNIFWADKNFWAPEVYYYNGNYYMLASFKSDHKCRGTQILVSDTPLGPFNPYSIGPVTPEGWECLDGTLYIDSDGSLWMLFSREWLQVQDGQICAIRLNSDLKSSRGDPLVLFCASEAPWTVANTGHIDAEKGDNYVTDGPYLYKCENGELLMLWSSFGKDGYAIGIARSNSGSIEGPWLQDEKPLFGKDGGHGMLFKTLEGELMLAIHRPNVTPEERPIFIKINEDIGTLSIK